MPYYVYRIENAGMEVLKQLTLLETYDSFKEAKKQARNLRAELNPEEDVVIKVMFADNELHAEEQLREKREKPIVMEHEK